MVDGRAAGATTGKGRARHHAADGLVMAIAGARNHRGRIVKPADHVNVAAEGGQR